MDDTIKALGQEWKALPRNNATEILAADSFYNDYIMPLSSSKFIQGYGSAAGIYDLMYVTVGTSWQPIALSIMAKKPKRVVFLATEEVKKDIDIALLFMEKQGFKLDDYNIYVINKSESRELLELVRNSYSCCEAKKACFDITGGTKAMAAAAAMIAASLDMDIFYVESNYLPVYRHPEPGSERMVQLERPQDL